MYTCMWPGDNARSVLRRNLGKDAYSTGLPRQASLKLYHRFVIHLQLSNSDQSEVIYFNVQFTLHFLSYSVTVVVNWLNEAGNIQSGPTKQSTQS